MSENLFARLRKITSGPALQVGVVQSVAAGAVVVQLPDGSQVQVRGAASVADVVFIRGGAIEGPAPSLPLVLVVL
jgi:hypothetical protein